jgi:lycopene beta-cyclase
LSGLSLAIELAVQREFQSKRILLIDREKKLGNDRTWCYWAQSGELPEVHVSKSWTALTVFGEFSEYALNMEDYRYHMVRSSDFYKNAFRIIEEAGNIEFLEAVVERFDPEEGRVFTSKGEFTADVLFNSAFPENLSLPEAGLLGFKTPFSGLKSTSESGGMLQHFKGWIIETDEDVFDPSQATLMDFRVEQKGSTRFVYVLPLAPNRALVEFTLFSNELLSAEVYEEALEQYIKSYLGLSNYQIEETEFGVIPMTDQRFPIQLGKCINIGTAAGFVKPSSGYAYKRTQEKIKILVANRMATGRWDPGVMRSSWRFRWYDSTLLRVLAGDKVGGAVVFSALFGRLPASLVFRFLDEKSTIWEEIRLMMQVPRLPFIFAAIKQLLRNGTF